MINLKLCCYLSFLLIICVPAYSENYLRNSKIKNFFHAVYMVYNPVSKK